jgi:transposase
VRKPLVVLDEEHERVYERVAAVDVAKASGVVCVRTPGLAGQPRQNRVFADVTAATGAITELGRFLVAEKVQMVTMEATSDYWRIWYVVLEMCGLAVQLVPPHQARQIHGRPKTDKLDAIWLARLTEWGLLRPCFVPPGPVRKLRDFTRSRADLVRDRTRCWQRLEKLLEGALIKVSSVASKLTTLSAQDMIRAMIAGERDPQVLASLARGRMKARHDALAAALDGAFDDRHGVLAQLLLDQIAHISGAISIVEAGIETAIGEIPQAWGVDADGTAGPAAGTGPDAAVLPAAERLAAIPGMSRELAIAVIAEIGLDMTRFRTPGHLVSWAGLCGTANQSGPRRRKDKKGHGNSYVRGYLGQAANGAAKTSTFLGERYHRIARRRGAARALVAVARSILVIIWHLLADPAARYHDLGPDHYASRTSRDKKIRSHVHQLQALGLEVTITPAAA